MTQHTPGPWAVDADAYPIFIYSESETWPLIDELGNEEGCKGAFIANAGDNKANARLIAAAPDLLKALKECRNAIQGGQEVAPYDSRGAGYEQTFGLAFLEYLNAAIAKAESK